MIEKLIPIDLPPGLFRNGTKYQAAGRWYDGHLMRWLEGGYPRPVGGWRVTDNASGAPLANLTGRPSRATAWRTAAGAVQTAVGTHTKLYVIKAGLTYDVTPAGLVTGNADSSLAGATYGGGLYGSGLFGTGLSSAALTEADAWQLDVFGDYLVSVFTADGKMYEWIGNTANPATQSAGSPTGCRALVVTPERFLVALGAGGDVRKVQWASQETTTVWTAAPGNSAGDFTLRTNGRIVCGRQTRQQTLIWTDSDLHTMTYIGGSLIYAFARAGDNCGIIAPNAVATVDTQAYWMGRNSFYVYDGFVRALPCEVHDYVFNDFNTIQVAKVFATSISEFGEIWWFYPSAASVENDRYVSYNYNSGHWSFGKIGRTAGFDRGAASTPVLLSATGTVYEHETGVTRGGEVPYLESGPMELELGDNTVRIQRIVPDEATLGDSQMYLYTSMYPDEPEVLNGPYTMANPTSIRLTARQARVRFEQVVEKLWQVGKPRLGIIVGGRR